MIDDEFDNLPDDDDLAFAMLEGREREKYRATYADLDEMSAIRAAQFDYMNAVHAAASELGVDALAKYRLPIPDPRGPFDKVFAEFFAESQRIVLRIRIARSRRLVRYSVELDAGSKSSLHTLIGKMRSIVEAANIEEGKKNALLARLNEFAAEVDRTRTRFDVAMKLVLTVASVTGEAIERVGTPVGKLTNSLGKFADQITRLIATAIESEDRRRLEGPKERVKLPPSEFDGGSQANAFSADLDDEIPF